MTAEIGILNRSGVALAADSAVTVGGNRRKKVFNSANKLFSLSKWHPVGIMVYNNANFMEIPWETIIKIYRDKLRDSAYGALYDYAKDFINFISTHKKLVTPDSEIHFIQRSIWNILMIF